MSGHPLAGTPFEDPPGTVRGSSSAGVWVNRGYDMATAWVQILSDEVVSHRVMWLMALPVIGSVPVSPAETARDGIVRDAAAALRLLVVEVAEHLGLVYNPEDATGSGGGDSADDVLRALRNLLADLSQYATDTGRTLVEVVDGLTAGNAPRCPVEKPDAPERCVFAAGHDGTHSWEHYREEGQ